MAVIQIFTEPESRSLMHNYILVDNSRQFQSGKFCNRGRDGGTGNGRGRRSDGEEDEDRSDGGRRGGKTMAIMTAQQTII